MEKPTNDNKKWWFIIIAQILLFIFIYCITTKYYGNKLDKLEHNLTASKDSLETIIMENGDLLLDKTSLIIEKNELYDELDIAKSDIKKLEKTLDSKIAHIAKLETTVKVKDTIYMKPDTVYIKDDITIKKFTWTDKWAHVSSTLTGESIKNSKLSIEKFFVNVPLQIGLTEDYDFWVKSSNPNVVFTEIKSAVIDGSPIKAKDKRFHHGVYCGFGFNYGFVNQSWDFGPSFGYAFLFSF